MNNLTVRFATIDDFDKIKKIESECEFDRYSDKMILSAIENSSILNLLLIVDGEVVGYCSSSIVVDESELLKIVVLKDFRGKGFGKLILKYMLDELKNKGVVSVFLEVRSANMPAKKIYKDSGFKFIHKRLKYYDGCEDAEVYRLGL